jgi:uncharacterized membrane protein
LDCGLDSERQNIKFTIGGKSAYKLSLAWGKCLVVVAIKGVDKTVSRAKFSSSNSIALGPKLWVGESYFA